MNTIFFPSGPYEWGSARMRSFWPAKFMDNAQALIYDEGMEYPDADNYIFQKIFDIPAARQMREDGAKVYWDVCDPVWWWIPTRCNEIIKHIDGVVASSIELANDFTEWSGMLCNTIPDRLDFSHFPILREHSDHAPVRFIWYGVSVNRIALFAALANLERLAANGYPIELTIFDDRPDQSFRISDKLPIYHLKWDVTVENQILSSHDIALLPPYPGPWGRVKSNNKTLTAWACGLPVTDGEYYDEMAMLVESAEKRHERAEIFTNVIRDAYDVRKSASEWEMLIGDDIS